MNPLLSTGTLDDYYDFEEYDFAPVEPGSDAPEGILELNSEGVGRLVSDMSDLFAGMYDPDLLDPVRFIRTSIRTIIDASSASDEVKARVDSQTWIPVYSVLGLPFTESWEEYGDDLSEERRDFRLEEIVTDRYRRKASAWNNVAWPEDFPEDLIQALESADLQARYQEEIEQRLNTPEARFLWKLHSRLEVEKHLRDFADDPNTPEFYQNLVEDYFNDKVQLELVEFGSRLSRTLVPQTIYLRYPKESQGGLLVFLGAPKDDAVVILRRAKRRAFIERSTSLHKLVLRRLPLYTQSMSGNTMLRYYRTYNGPTYSLTSPLQFRSTADVFGALHNQRVMRLNMDIDLLVSTDSERLTDDLLKVSAEVLEALALVTTLSAGPSLALTRAMVGFLATAGATSIKTLRGVTADYPDEALAFYNQALADTIKAMVGPIAELATGTDHSSKIIDKVVEKVFEKLSE
ncbi:MULTISPECIES: hypothetical protein [unclassified Pseudomonas]|uniref:hypothetical protein n=1 Tax=unclassified Pseudomonas TaxID=196821 RepID=UPI0025F1A44F|nr:MULTISPECIES: hypothetical protein [unclassified Pseudomonas]